VATTNHQAACVQTRPPLVQFLVRMGNWPFGGRNKSALLSAEMFFRLLGQPPMPIAIEGSPAAPGSVQCTDFKEETEDEEVS
jgi:hypothetical protein